MPSVFPDTSTWILTTAVVTGADGAAIASGLATLYSGTLTPETYVMVGEPQVIVIDATHLACFVTYLAAPET